MSPDSSPPAPILTVVVSPRERQALAEASLRSVLADDALPFDLVYIDIQSPPAVADAIAGLCAGRGARLIRYEAWIAPSAARKRALADVRSRYVAFIDNDVLVEPGCFARLVDCAEATGAALVGPLYLQGGHGGEPIIHMAGGDLVRTGGDEGPLVREQHRLAHAPAEAAQGLRRQPVGNLEYHCLLARTDFLRRPDAISDDVLLVHEHIDIALKAREAGLEVWLEPEARVVYQGMAPLALADLPVFRQRWEEAACEASMAAFTRQWPLADEAGFHRGVRRFLAARLDEARLLRAGATGAGRDAAMPRAELAQTRFALREQAASHGYPPEQILAIDQACDFATLIFDGLYRPDGRPFLNHALGTASVLMRYDAPASLVLAGLLHAAYSHRPDWMDRAEVTRILSSGGEVDAIVRGLPRAKALLSAADRGEAIDAGALTLEVAKGLCVEAANEADMRLSGEYCASGRPLVIGPRAGALLDEALGLVGLAGLAMSAAAPPGEGPPASVLGLGTVHGSFRLHAAERRAEPVRSRR